MYNNSFGFSSLITKDTKKNNKGISKAWRAKHRVNWRKDNPKIGDEQINDISTKDDEKIETVVNESSEFQTKILKQKLLM